MFQSASILSNGKGKGMGMGMGMGMGFGKGHAIWRAERALAAGLVCTILAREVETVLDLLGWPEMVALSYRLDRCIPSLHQDIITLTNTTPAKPGVESA
jgi:hypothetical protein